MFNIHINKNAIPPYEAFVKKIKEMDRRQHPEQQNLLSPVLERIIRHKHEIRRAITYGYDTEDIRTIVQNNINNHIEMELESHGYSRKTCPLDTPSVNKNFNELVLKQIQIDYAQWSWGKTLQRVNDKMNEN